MWRYLIKLFEMRVGGNGVIHVQTVNTLNSVLRIVTRVPVTELIDPQPLRARGGHTLWYTQLRGIGITGLYLAYMFIMYFNNGALF